MQPTFAQKTVDVQLLIEEQGLKDAYSQSLIDIQTEGALLIVTEMTSEIPYIRFSNDSADNELVFTMHEVVPNQGMYQIDLSMQLKYQGETKGTQMSIKYRGIEDFFTEFPNTKEEFLVEFGLLIRDWIREEKESMIKDVLSAVSISEQAHPNPDSLYWVLEFDPESLKIGWQSKFVICSRIDTFSHKEEIIHNTKYTGQKNGERIARYDDPGASDNIFLVSGTGWLVKGVYLVYFEEFDSTGTDVSASIPADLAATLPQ